MVPEAPFDRSCRELNQSDGISKASAKSSSILLQRAWQELLKSATVFTLFENGLGSGWLGLLLVNSPRLKALCCVVSDTSRNEARLDVLFEIASLIPTLALEFLKPRCSMVSPSDYQDPVSPAAWRPIPDYSAWDILSYSPLDLGRTVYSDCFFSAYALIQSSIFSLPDQTSRQLWPAAFRQPRCSR